MRGKTMGASAVHLIGAACGVGSPDARCADGPKRLRARLMARGKLRGSLIWLKTITARIAKKESKKVAPRTLVPFARQLARTVRSSVARGARFIVVGGDHSSAVGTWNGARAGMKKRGALGLIWIDAHMDAHTPQTSPSGRLHGMPLAALLGFGDASLTRLGFGRGPALLPQHLCLIGARSFEPAEAELLKRLGVRVYSMEDVRARGMAMVMEEAVAHVQSGTSGFGVSIDLDAIDPRDAPAVTTPVAEGLSGGDVVAALRATVDNPRFLGLEIAEFNPDGDRDGRTAALMEQMIDAVAAAQPLDASVDLERRYCARNYEPLPVVLTRAKGVYVWDLKGQRYLDMMAAYSAVSFGHAHPRLTRALSTQAKRLSMVSRAYYTDRLGPLAQRVCALTKQDRFLPMNTGAEAVETAIKAARKWAYKVKGVIDGRAEIICCSGNFHGRTLGALAMSSEPQYRDGFGPFPSGFVQIPYGNAAALEAAITPHTAAFIVEPVQGEGGIIVPPPGYLKACADICRRRNVLLICDEVQTGLGRTGKLLAAEHDGVIPDAVLLGKALGGGLLPISAFLAREEVMRVFKPGDHGSTFGGNPLACAVALEALNLLVEDRLVERAAELGEYFIRKLRALPHPFVRQVRGRGLFVGLEVDVDMVHARELCKTLLRHGVLTKDTHQTVLRFVPPLTITRAQLDEAVKRIARGFDDTEITPRSGTAAGF